MVVDIIKKGFKGLYCESSIDTLLFEYKGYATTYIGYDFKDVKRPVLKLAVIDKESYNCLFTFDLDVVLSDMKGVEGYMKYMKEEIMQNIFTH